MTYFADVAPCGVSPAAARPAPASRGEPRRAPGGGAPLVALIGGDMPTRAMVRFLLEEDGCEVVDAAHVAHVDPQAPLSPDAGITLLVLIAGRHQDDVIEHLARLRQLGYTAPALLLTRGANLDLRRRAFAHRVKDVVNVPISAQDLQHRLRAALGDQVPPNSHREGLDYVRAGGLTLRCAGHEVSDGAQWSVRVTRREAALLKVLMMKPGQVVTHAEILDAVWQARAPMVSNAVAVLMRRLRSKLTGPQGDRNYVRTIHGKGYMFEARATPRTGEARESAAGPPVLVVDDDKAILHSTAEILQWAGYSVACGVGHEASLLARQLCPRVILLDINMPGMDGVEICRHLRANPRTAGIPVIACSAGHNLRRHAQMAVDDFLPKPFGVDELLLRVEKWAGPGGARHLA